MPCFEKSSHCTLSRFPSWLLLQQRPLLFLGGHYCCLCSTTYHLWLHCWPILTAWILRSSANSLPSSRFALCICIQRVGVGSFLVVTCIGDAHLPNPSFVVYRIASHAKNLPFIGGHAFQISLMYSVVVDPKIRWARRVHTVRGQLPGYVVRGVWVKGD